MIRRSQSDPSALPGPSPTPQATSESTILSQEEKKAAKELNSKEVSELIAQAEGIIKSYYIFHLELNADKCHLLQQVVSLLIHEDFRLTTSLLHPRRVGHHILVLTQIANILLKTKAIDPDPDLRQHWETLIQQYRMPALKIKVSENPEAALRQLSNHVDLLPFSSFPNYSSSTLASHQFVRLELGQRYLRGHGTPASLSREQAIRIGIQLIEEAYQLNYVNADAIKALLDLHEQGLYHYRRERPLATKECLIRIQNIFDQPAPGSDLYLDLSTNSLHGEGYYSGLLMGEEKEASPRYFDKRLVPSVSGISKGARLELVAQAEGMLHYYQTQPIYDRRYIQPEILWAAAMIAFQEIDLQHEKAGWRESAADYLKVLYELYDNPDITLARLKLQGERPEPEEKTPPSLLKECLYQASVIADHDPKNYLNLAYLANLYLDGRARPAGLSKIESLSIPFELLYRAFTIHPVNLHILRSLLRLMQEALDLQLELAKAGKENQAETCTNAKLKFENRLEKIKDADKDAWIVTRPTGSFKLFENFVKGRYTKLLERDVNSPATIPSKAKEENAKHSGP